MTEAATAVQEKSEVKETPIANVSANLFRAAYVCVSREETRYYLNGVHITPHPNGGALLISTDGHRMIVIRDDSAWCRESCIVQMDKHGLEACRPGRAKAKVMKPRDAVAELKKVPQEKRLVVDHDGRAEIEGAWRSAGKVLIDGTFPDWRRVCPFHAKWEQKASTFNSKYIAAFGEVASIIRGSKDEGIGLRIITDGPGDPALVHIGEITNAFGILMPMRSVEREGFPQWMEPIRKAVEAEKAAALAAAAAEAKKLADQAAAALAAAQPPKPAAIAKPKPEKKPKARPAKKAKKRKR